VVLMGLLLVWGTLFLELVHQWGTRRVASSIPFQVCVVGAAGVFLLPTTLLIPGFHHALVLIAERMALGVSVCVCALLGAARPRMLERYAVVAVALIFFGFLYRDERSLNALEDRMQGAVAQSAPGHGVVIRGVKADVPCGSTNWKAFEDRRPNT
jgi:Na+/H+ antiporter NhaB